MNYQIELEVPQILFPCPNDLEVGKLHMTIDLELEIASYSEEIEIEDFNIIKVYVFDDSTGSEYALKTVKQCGDFRAKYGTLIRQELDSDTGQCKNLVNEITDYLQDGQTERDIDDYEYNREYGVDDDAENIMYGGVDY